MDDYNWIERLIASVEARPVLYDRNLREYNNRELKEHAWDEVCDEVVLEWDQLSVDEQKKKCRQVQQRWLNLRSCFAREVRELKRSAAAGTAPKRRRYLYYQQLLFLQRIFDEKEATPDSSLADPNDVSQEATDDVAGDDDSSCSPGQDVKEVHTAPDRHNAPSVSPVVLVEKLRQSRSRSSRPAPLSPPPPPAPSSSLPRKHKGLASPCTPPSNSVAKRKKTTIHGQSPPGRLKNESETCDHDQEDIDEDKSFALSLVPGLRRLGYDRKFEAKMEIMRVLHKFSTIKPSSASQAGEHETSMDSTMFVSFQ